MGIPSNDELDRVVDELYDAALDRAAQPGQLGIVTGRSARLQAASSRRLAVAIQSSTDIQVASSGRLIKAIEASTSAQVRMADAQERTNVRMERLERVGIWVAVASAALAAVQVGAALIELFDRN